MMTAPRFAERDPDLDGARVLVVGLGKSGLAAARLAASKGARVTAVDTRSEAQLGAQAAAARDAGVTVVAGGYGAADAEGHDLVLVSPGVPRSGALFARAEERGLPIWGEVELAARYCKGKIVGISGSNGKSTVTSLCGAMLRRAGIAGGTGGNLDVPFADLLAEDGTGAVHVVELSSFQLESVEALRPAVAALLNLAPDHLDRYAGLDEYAAAKARLFEVQAADGWALVNEDDDASRRFEAAIRGRRIGFSTRRQLPAGAFLRDARLVLRTPGGEDDLLFAGELRIAGEHNHANALAAALAARLAGCPPEAIAETLRTFEALPHRLQRVAVFSGVAFYNDSKATNVDATLRAIGAFPDASVHLILGGRDKGADWPALHGAVARHVKKIWAIGEAAGEIEAAFGGRADVQTTGTLDRAVDAAFRAAAPGDVILLSPACASFDQYTSFERRGDHFAQLARTLEREQGDA